MRAKTLRKYFSLQRHTLDSLKGQNLGFPLRPYLSNCAPFFRAVMACFEMSREHELEQNTNVLQTGNCMENYNTNSTIEQEESVGYTVYTSSKFIKY